MVLANDNPDAPTLHVHSLVRVLVVEDDPFQSFLIARHLSHHDRLWVEVEHDADHAANRIRTEQWDLVITDVRLGEVDGIDLANASGATPVLVISGDPRAVHDAQQRGHGNVIGALQKPLNLALLLRKVIQFSADRSGTSLAWDHVC